MRSVLSTLLILLSGLSFVSSSAPFTRGADGLFGISRGGGLFGKSTGSEESDSPSAGGPKYPAMTQDEVKDFLEHIPVFAVTDSQGSGVVFKQEDESSYFYFFMSPVQANATLHQLKGTNEGMDLKVSAFSLGRIWFDLLHASPDKEVTLKAPGGDALTSQGVEYRLVPDTRDLLGARMLLTMTPEDSEKIKDGMTEEIAQAAFQKAMGESPKFNSTYNEIPVFTISQMRMQKRQEEGESGEPITLLPMYFSLQNMVATWQQFMSSAPQDVQGVEPAINLVSLHEMVEMMQKESEVDWRNVVLVPSTPISGGDDGASDAKPVVADTMSTMGGGGATLGDL